MRPTPRTTDRRGFVRAAAALVALGPAAVSACGRGGEPSGRRGPHDPPQPGGERHTVRPWGADAVLVASSDPLLAAYVSRATQRVFVDPALRDRAVVALGAHVSVSTGLWRIALPGDPGRAPIQPGDAAREFEERPLGEWRPDVVPAEGDTRLGLGAPSPWVLALSCEPVVGTERWCSGGPWTLRRAAAEGDGLVRERLVEVGRATAWDARACVGDGHPVRCLTWTVPED